MLVAEYIIKGFTFFHLGLLLFVSPSLSAFEVPFLAFVATEREIKCKFYSRKLLYR